MQTFQEWLKANEFASDETEAAALTEKQRAKLLAQWKAENEPKPEPKPEKSAASASFDDVMDAHVAESQRVEHITQSVAARCKEHLGNTEKINSLRELGQAAIADKKMTAQTFDLQLIRADRMIGPMVFAPSSPQVNETVIEAALCISANLPNPEKSFSEQTLDAAHKLYKGRYKLSQLIFSCARQAGFRGEHDVMSAAKYAFRHESNDDLGGYASNFPSTLSISNILANTANKFLRVAFEALENSWRDIADIRSNPDFKQSTEVALTGDNTLELLPAGGEIKHGTLADLAYTNQVYTYAKMLGIDRTQLINDDLGALSGASRRLSRGAGLAFNTVFWTEYLDDAAFFPTDKSLLNYDDGATDSVLSLAGLENASTIFSAQTDPDGKILGAIPRILLVPKALENTALSLMSTILLPSGGTALSVTPQPNIWASRFKVVSSAYLGDTALGGSATAWYLLADPGDLPVIQVAFLNGNQSPMVETSDVEFNRLGIQMRCVFDFGVNKMEYRGGLKLKGAA